MQSSESLEHADRIQEIAGQEAGASETREFRIFGPPGTGKTTNVSRQVGRAVERFGPGSILVTSFSRAAAAELAGRDLPIAGDRVGTLHSHCWHALGGPEIAESQVDEWNRDNPNLTITPLKKASRQAKLDGEESQDTEDGSTGGSGDDLLEMLNRFRGMEMNRHFWSAALVDFEKRWKEYKSENGLLDFTDLIDVCLRDVYVAPKSPSVIFCDEAQDLNRMQLKLVRSWGRHTEHFILAGDDDQASLPGSMVLTEGGESIPVEMLNPARHRLVSYDRAQGCLNGLRKGHTFRIEPSLYCGDAVRVEVADRVTSTTHNHPWLFRWKEASRAKHVVYLMRKGESFRVGWCKLIRADGSCHLGVRAYLEHADAAWILRVCDSRSEASMWESYVAAQYGISTVVWRPMHDQCGGHYTPEVISTLFGMLGDHAQRGAHCLRAFGRDMDLPFYESGTGNRFGAQTIRTAACNLLPGVMAVPIAAQYPRVTRGVDWLPIDSIERFPYDGCVYGLRVPPYHTYVADGIVTHNCIYGFTGATPEAFLDPDIPAAHKIILKQSYRVPRAVHTLADRLIRRVGRRQEKEYLPRDADGRLARLASGTWEVPEYAVLETAMTHLDRGQSVMFLVACSYMLAPLIAVLRKNGVPFHNPYRKSNGAWNPMRQDQGSASNRLRSLLVAHSDYGGGARPWVEGDLALWAEWLKSKGVLKHGAKAALGKANADVQVDYDRLREVFEPAALDSLLAASSGTAAGLINWWRSRVTAAVEDRVRFPAKVAATRGPHALYETPRAVVGTIHSVKGGESDCVFLFPDLSNSGYNAYRRTGLPHDSVIRQFYVGATRARDTLYICRQLCDMAVTI